MNRLAWRLAGAVSRLLAPDERDAVLGDLAEAGANGAQALASVLGLAARRQAAVWTHWRPWLALVTLAIPAGILLCLAARRVADGSAVDLWLYVSNWDWPALRNSGARSEMVHQFAAVALQYLTLACWSWMGGLALGWASRDSLPATALVFGALAFCGSLAGPPPRHLGMALFHTARVFRGNAAVFAGLFFRDIFPHLVQAVLVVAPAIWGIRQAHRWGTWRRGRREGNA